MNIKRKYKVLKVEKGFYLIRERWQYKVLILRDLLVYLRGLGRGTRPYVAVLG